MFIVPFNVANVIEFLSSSFCRSSKWKFVMSWKCFSGWTASFPTHFVITLCAAVRCMHNRLSLMEKKTFFFMIESSFSSSSPIIIHFVASSYYNFTLLFQGWKKEFRWRKFSFLKLNGGLQRCSFVRGCKDKFEGRKWRNHPKSRLNFNFPQNHREGQWAMFPLFFGRLTTSHWRVEKKCWHIVEKKSLQV